MNNKSKLYFWALISLLALWLTAFVMSFVFEQMYREWFGFPLFITLGAPFLYALVKLSKEINIFIQHNKE